MGHPLVEGDIEELGGRGCVVCPAHRYRIDLTDGHKVDTDLDGHVCASKDQKQRIYKAKCDEQYIYVDWEELQPSRLEGGGVPIASDAYNLGSLTTEKDTKSFRKPSYGIFGTSDQSGLTNDHPADDPPLVLSQGSQGSPVRTAPSVINFPAARVDPPHIARRKAATAAILAKSYRPPTSQTAPPSAPTAGASIRQRTLFESWGVQQVGTTQPLEATGSSPMETE